MKYKYLHYIWYIFLCLVTSFTLVAFPWFVALTKSLWYLFLAIPSSFFANICLAEFTLIFRERLGYDGEDIITSDDFFEFD